MNKKAKIAIISSVCLASILGVTCSLVTTTINSNSTSNLNITNNSKGLDNDPSIDNTNGQNFQNEDTNDLLVTKDKTPTKWCNDEILITGNLKDKYVTEINQKDFNQYLTSIKTKLFGCLPPDAKIMIKNFDNQTLAQQGIISCDVNVSAYYSDNLEYVNNLNTTNQLPWHHLIVSGFFTNNQSSKLISNKIEISGDLKNKYGEDVSLKELSDYLENIKTDLFSNLPTDAKLIVENLDNRLAYEGKISCDVSLSSYYEPYVGYINNEANNKQHKSFHLLISGFMTSTSVTKWQTNEITIKNELKNKYASEVAQQEITDYLNSIKSQLFGGLPSDAKVLVSNFDNHTYASSGIISCNVSVSSYYSNDYQYVNNLAEGANPKWYSLIINGFTTNAEYTQWKTDQTTIKNNLKDKYATYVSQDEIINYLNSVKNELFGVLPYDAKIIIKNFDNSTFASDGKITCDVDVTSYFGWNLEYINNTNPGWHHLVIDGFFTNASFSQWKTGEILVSSDLADKYPTQVSLEEIIEYLNSIKSQLFTNLPPDAKIMVKNFDNSSLITEGKISCDVDVTTYYGWNYGYASNIGENAHPGWHHLVLSGFFTNDLASKWKSDYITITGDLKNKFANQVNENEFIEYLEGIKNKLYTNLPPDASIIIKNFDNSKHANDGKISCDVNVTSYYAKNVGYVKNVDNSHQKWHHLVVSGFLTDQTATNYWKVNDNINKIKLTINHPLIKNFTPQMPNDYSTPTNNPQENYYQEIFNKINEKVITNDAKIALTDLKTKDNINLFDIEIRKIEVNNNDLTLNFLVRNKTSTNNDLYLRFIDEHIQIPSNDIVDITIKTNTPFAKRFYEDPQNGKLILYFDYYWKTSQISIDYKLNSQLNTKKEKELYLNLNHKYSPTLNTKVNNASYLYYDDEIKKQGEQYLESLTVEQIKNDIIKKMNSDWEKFSRTVSGVINVLYNMLCCANWYDWFYGSAETLSQLIIDNVTPRAVNMVSLYPAFVSIFKNQTLKVALTHDGVAEGIKNTIKAFAPDIIPLIDIIINIFEKTPQEQLITAITNFANSPIGQKIPKVVFDKLIELSKDGLLDFVLDNADWILDLFKPLLDGTLPQILDWIKPIIKVIKTQHFNDQPIYCLDTIISCNDGHGVYYMEQILRLMGMQSAIPMFEKFYLNNPNARNINNWIAVIKSLRNLYRPNWKDIITISDFMKTIRFNLDIEHCEYDPKTKQANIIINSSIEFTSPANIELWRLYNFIPNGIMPMQGTIIQCLPDNINFRVGDSLTKQIVINGKLGYAFHRDVDQNVVMNWRATAETHSSLKLPKMIEGLAQSSSIVITQNVLDIFEDFLYHTYNGYERFDPYLPTQNSITNAVYGYNPSTFNNQKVTTKTITSKDKEMLQGIAKDNNETLTINDPYSVMDSAGFWRQVHWTTNEVHWPRFDWIPKFVQLNNYTGSCDIKQIGNEIIYGYNPMVILVIKKLYIPKIMSVKTKVFLDYPVKVDNGKTATDEIDFSF